MRMLAAGPAPTVIELLVTPGSAPEVNWRVRAPIVPPMLRPEKDAVPAEACTVAVPPSVPPPDAMLAVTLALLFAMLPNASLSTTIGWVANATPALAVLDGCWVTSSCVALPAPTLIVLLAGVVNPPSVKLSVRSPTSPSILKSVNVATPATAALVVVPASVPRPLASEATALPVLPQTRVDSGPPGIAESAPS